MNHATEGTLQAYLDDEVPGSAHAELARHLASCDPCTSELTRLRVAGSAFRDAMQLTDRSAPPVYPVAIGRRRTRRNGLQRLVESGLAKAAILMLVLAGAVAAIPPVQQAVSAQLERLTSLFRRDAGAPSGSATAPAVVAPPASEPAPSGASILPVNGRVTIVLSEPAPDVVVRARLTDDERATVATEGAENVRFLLSEGRLQVNGIDVGTITVDLPRRAAAAVIEVDGLVYVYKEGDLLRMSPTAGVQTGPQIEFRIGT